MTANRIMNDAAVTCGSSYSCLVVAVHLRALGFQEEHQEDVALGHRSAPGLQPPGTLWLVRQHYCFHGVVIANFLPPDRSTAVTVISFGRTTRRLNGVPSRLVNSFTDSTRFSPLPNRGTRVV